MSLAEKMIGTWTLIHYEYPVDGKETYALGENPTGFLMYNPDGIMSANMMTSNVRPAYESGDLHFGTEEEMAKAASGYVGYAAQFNIKEVDEENNRLVVEHTMEVSLNPTWLGNTQERFVTYDPEADTITITASVNDPKLVWRKVSR